MCLKNLDGFNYENLKRELDEFGPDADRMITFVDYVFSDCIQDQISILNSKFGSKVGNSAYPRDMILLVLLYCFDSNINNHKRIAKECRINDILKIITRKYTPSDKTFGRFFVESDPITIKKIFLYSLVELNDLELMDFIHLFIDSTDAIVQGSRFHTINEKKIKAFKLLNEHSLLHDKSKKSKKRLLQGLDILYEENKDNEETCKLIRIIRRNIDIFNEKIFKSVPEFERILDETDKKTLSIAFPEATLIKTKKGRSDFAFMLHEVMTRNKIVFSGILSEKSNDSNCMEDLLAELIENLYLLLELQKEYGKRSNYKEIEHALDNAIMVFDSGYFDLENLKTIDKYKINAIILSRKIARQTNNQIREDNDIPQKNKNKNNEEKDSRKSLKWHNNYYTCKMGKKLELNRSWEVNKQDGSQEELPEHLRETVYEYKCFGCSGCKFEKTCTIKVVQDRITPLEHEMQVKSAKYPYNRIYNERFHCSEGINGYLKTREGILYLMASSLEAARNEIHIRNLCYNLIRKVNLKGTIR